MSHRAAVLRCALGSRPLRRVELAFLGFGIAEYGVWVAVLVYAYQRGGTAATAAIAAVQLLPAAFVAPLAARLIDSRGSAAVLFGGYVLQAASLAITAGLLLSGAASPLVYAGATAAASAVTLTRPAQAALLPALVETPAQLTAANAVSGWVENLSLLAGPAIASVMLAVAGPGGALTLFGTLVAGSASVVLPLRALDELGSEHDAEACERSLAGSLQAAPGALPALGMLVAEYAVLGALDVLQVVFAATVLGLGAGGAGYLGAAFGAGGLAGAAAAGLLLVGRQRLARPLLLAGVGWGGAFIALGAWPAVGAALCLLALSGASRTMLDVGGRTILHRTVPARLHGRVFGVLEGLEMLGLALGSILVPVSIALVGARGAVALLGALLIIVPMLTAPALRAIERATPDLTVELGVVRSFPIFAMLSAAVLEDLARALARVEVPAGESIVAEGEAGGEFFFIAGGELEVSVRGSRVRRLTPGDWFGEIALLGDGLRSATVTATSAVRLYALGRAPFLEAVTGSPQANRAARELVAKRLDRHSAQTGRLATTPRLVAAEQRARA